MDRKLFSERLKNLRVQKNLTMVDIADTLEINKTSVFTWESTKTIPSTEKLIALADLLEVSLDYLVGRSDDPSRH